MFYFLEEKENKGESFTLDEMVEATGYKMSSIRTYYGKRLKGLLVEEVSDDLYRVNGLAAFDEESFIDYLTQRSSPADLSALQEEGSAGVEERGRAREEALAESMIQRSAASFKLALEAFHRPLEGAHLSASLALLLVAWELMLRAELFKIRGLPSLDEPLALSALLPKFFPNPRDPVRRNLEWSLRLRDHTHHLLIEELTPYLSRHLLASALNFRRRWEAVAQGALFTRGGGLLALGVEGSVTGLDEIAEHYGDEAAEQMERLLEELSLEESQLHNHTAFQTSPAHRLVLSPVIDANQIVLSDHHATLEASEVMRQQVREEWPSSHPYVASEVVHEINRRLPYDLRLTASAIEVIDVAHQVRSAPRSPLYLRAEEHPFHYYSKAYVDWVVNSITERGDWIKRAQEAARRLEE